MFAAYGWADLIPALAGKPGATAPSPHKTPEQEAAEEELLARLVALNKERAEEERRGIVRWLRPDYQIPKLGHKVSAPEAGEQTEADLAAPESAEGKPAWPKDELAQIRAVRDMLGRAAAPLAPKAWSKPSRAATRRSANNGSRKSCKPSSPPRRPPRPRRAGRRQTLFHPAIGVAAGTDARGRLTFCDNSYNRY